MFYINPLLTKAWRKNLIRTFKKPPPLITSEKWNILDVFGNNSEQSLNSLGFRSRSCSGSAICYFHTKLSSRLIHHAALPKTFQTRGCPLVPALRLPTRLWLVLLHATLPLMVLSADFEPPRRGETNHEPLSFCGLWGRDWWHVRISLNRSIIMHHWALREQSRSRKETGGHAGAL